MGESDPEGRRFGFKRFHLIVSCASRPPGVQHNQSCVLGNGAHRARRSSQIIDFSRGWEGGGQPSRKEIEEEGSHLVDFYNIRPGNGDGMHRDWVAFTSGSLQLMWRRRQGWKVGVPPGGPRWQQASEDADSWS